MKKNILFLLTIIVFTNVFISCSELLNAPDPNRIEEKDFWKTEDDAILGLAAVYDAFQSGNLMGSESYRSFDRLTDNAYTRGGSNWSPIDSDNLLTSDAIITGIWSDLYIVIARANNVIVNVEKIADISEEIKNRIIAEAKFLRAYAYYDLTALWGDVPFYLKPKRGGDKPEEAKSKTDIYEYITNELNAIKLHLPDVIPVSENGRVGKGAVLALLGKYYLTEKKWNEAASALNELITSNKYSLFPDYAALFTPAGEFSSESLFEINFKASSIDAGESFSVRLDTTVAPIVPSRNWLPIPNLVESYLCVDGKPIKDDPVHGSKSPLYNANNRYVNRDPRLRATILTNLDNTPGGKRVWDWKNANSFAVKKYTYISGEQYSNGGPQNYYAIRFADVLLMYAEAQNEAVGPVDSVYYAMNSIRRRVSMPDIPTGLNQDKMREYIRNERRWEFAMEHQRLFDLKRWGLLKELSNAAYPTTKKYTEPRVFAWPYPQLEMDRNIALKAQGQNDGYQK